MDRSRAAASALFAEEVLPLPSLPDMRDLPAPELPGGPSLNERLEALRAVGRSREDVTSFVEGLARPLGPGETARHRADLLLDVLEDESLCGLTTRDGVPLGGAAMDALQTLGFPYALEITPAMLDQARGSTSPSTLSASFLGAGLALMSALAVAQEYGSWTDVFMEKVSLGNVFFLYPALLAALSREVGLRLPRRLFQRVHRFFNGVQWLVGAMGLGIMSTSPSPMNLLLLLTALLSAWSLREGPPNQSTP